MEIKVDNFTIKLHRAEETSHETEVKRLATYVSTICELGLSQEKSSSKFNMQRNLPKDIITILRILSLPEDEQEQAIENNIERHKRAGMREKIEFAKTLQPPKHILNRLYNYLLSEEFRIC